jgi:hypothetical protein
MKLILIFLNIMNNLKSEKLKEYKHKISSNYESKNISENSFSKTKTRVSQICYTVPSEESTLNTRTNVLKEKKKFILYEELYQNNFINLFNNLNKAFESLEHIIINDNNNNVENEESSGINSFSCKICNIDIKEKEFINKSIINNTKGRDKSKSISIPKLNFNRIFEYYQNENVKIIETQIEKMHKNLMKHHHKHHHHNHLQMKDDNYDNEIVNKN